MKTKTPPTAFTPPKRTLRDYGYVSFTGACMGAADVVPGVSGGTMAFILGIYEELLAAIKSVNLALLQKALRLDFRGCFEQVPWRFLLALLIGLGASALSLVHAVSYLMDHHEPMLFAFFFGLVLASIAILARQIRWSGGSVLAIIAGTAFAWAFVTLAPHQIESTPLVLFFSGMIAIMAMILPGISGSFLLLILGQYKFIVDSAKNLDVVALLPALLGMVIGLMGFSRILSWCLARYHNLMIALLTGFMVGSLRKIYPFKEVLETLTKKEGEVVVVRDRLIAPALSDPALWQALGLAVLGMGTILLIDHIHRKKSAVV